MWVWVWMWVYYSVKWLVAWLPLLRARLPWMRGPALVGGSRGQVNTAWLRAILQHALPQTSLPALRGAEIKRGGLRGGLTADMYSVTLEWETAESVAGLPSSVVVKANVPSHHALHSCAMLSTWREGYFYGVQTDVDVARRFAFVPQCYDVRASRLTGEYTILLEDLSQQAISGVALLGNQCWGAVPLPAGVEQDHGRIFGTIFTHVARLHAAYWRDSSLLHLDWLKASDWLQGHGRARWELAFAGMRRKWASVRPPGSSTTSANGIVWCPTLIRAMDQYLAATTWDAYRAAFDVTKPTTPFTLVHGDFHAGNVLWCTTAREAGLPPFYLVDWSEVGVSDPFTELAQFLVSNATIAFRRQHERRLFEEYWTALMAAGGERIDARVFSLDQCWEHYKLGGIERWLQMVIILAMITHRAPQNLPVKYLQWFHDQAAAFVQDHFASCQLPPVFRSVYCLS